jgi:hypothetical protein
MPISRARAAAARRFAALWLAALALAACDPATMAGGSAPSRTKVTVAGRAVTVAAPPGFCVDTKSTAVTADGAFVLMSDCALLGAVASSRPPVGGALTASISSGSLVGEGDASDTLEDLAAFAATPDGRALLGRSGRPERVRILNSQARNGVLYVLVEDRGPMPVAGIDRRFWRAFLEVNDRMAVLSELGFEASGTDPQQGLNQLAALARSIQAANGG